MSDYLDTLSDVDKTSTRIGLTQGKDGKPCGLYLPEKDRMTHTYVIGSSGTGKSKALAQWVVDGIFKERGCGVIDPHGDLVRDIASYCLLHSDNVINVDLTDPDWIVGFNPLEMQEGVDPFTQTLELVEVFRKIWNLTDEGAPRLLEILRNAILTLIYSGGTLLEIEPLLTNQDFREDKIKYVQNEAVVTFWRDRFDKWPEREKTLNVESTLNKVSTFTSDPRLRLMFSAKKSTFDFRKIMDEGKVILINLSKGVMRTNSFLLGALFIAKIQMAAMSRQDLDPENRKPFYLYVDEFQNYATESFCEIMSESRKYGLCLTLAHQSLDQLSEKLQAIILGNTRNIITFRTSRKDAEILCKSIFKVNPMKVKMYYDDRLDFFSLQEQWEQNIKDMADLPDRFGLLKTRGKKERWFYTYNFVRMFAYEAIAEEIREANIKNGYIKSLKELDDSLMLMPPLTFDEPQTYLET